MFTGMCMVCGHIQPSGRPYPPCTACGDQMHAPFNLDDTVTVTLSKDELQLLTKWACRYAELDDVAAKITSSSVKVVTLVLDRLALQTDIQLTPAQFAADQ